MRTKFFNPFKFGDLHKWRILVTWDSAVWYDKLVLSTYLCISYQIRSNDLLTLFLLFWILGALRRVIYCIFFFVICAVFTVDLHLLGFRLSLGKFSIHSCRCGTSSTHAWDASVIIDGGACGEGAVSAVARFKLFLHCLKVSLVSPFYHICVYSMALQYWQS